MKVLVVEDDPKMAALVRRGLTENGNATDIAPDGEQALWMARAHAYDAIVLDVMLPGADGFATCAALRESGVWAPVLMLTARDAVEDRVAGLDAGADDYLTKPFSLAELRARLRALVRRGAADRPTVLEVGDLRLDPATRQVWRGETEVRLSSKEYALLELFMRRPGEVISRYELLEHGWDMGYDNRSNVITVYIRYLPGSCGSAVGGARERPPCRSRWVLRDIRASDREELLKVKLTERSAMVRVAASTQQLTSHAGLVLVRELAGRLGVRELLDQVTVKKRSRGYSPAQAILGLCETLIAGGECLDDIALLRGDSAQGLLRGHGLPEATTLGRFLRRFSLGHIGQLNRALEELFARVHPLLDRETVTLDLDATYIEHYGPVGSRQGTRGTYKGKVCWHPLLCFVGETGEWLHAKLRNGHAGASTGATRFLDECLRRLPEGARLFLRADEGFWGQHFFADCERKQITYAVGAPLIASVRVRISEIAEQDWQPASYRGGSEVASFRWRPKSWKQERRFIVRRDPVETGEQLTLEGREWHYWALVSNDSERSADELECWHRGKANLENQIKEAKLGLGLDNLPCKSFHANWAYLLCTLLAFNLLAWLKLLALPERERSSYVKRLRFRFIAVAGTVGHSGRRLVLRLSAGYPLLADFIETLQRIRGLARAPA